MELVLVALLVIGVIVFIAYPLFVPPKEERQVEPNSQLTALTAQRDSMYDAIRDLDFDFQLGKLSPADYQSLREQYKVRAAATLQELDAVSDHLAQPAAGADDRADEIESQVSRLRQKPDAADAIEQEVTRRRKRALSSAPRCAKCGTPYHTGELFCARCGTKLRG